MGEISTVYTELGDGIMIATVLSGFIIFPADLIRRLPMRMRIGMVGVWSYQRRTKPCRRARRFGGFDIEDVFVVGYGFEYDGLYRNLPYAGVLSPAAHGGGSAS